jgi:serine/threonine protein kinase
LKEDHITDNFLTPPTQEQGHTDMTQTLLYGSSEKPSTLTSEELRQGLGLSSGENISDYKSLYAIGVGGMGTVFGGYEPGLNRKVALKLLRPQYRNHADRIEDFIREARTTAQIDHPNIVPVHRLGVFDDVGVYFTMKKVAGETLQTILKNLRQTRAGKTTILIAHRISTIQNLDKILFLEDGCLAAVGTHAELYESNPAYRKMVELQKLETEGGGDHA